MTQTSAKPDVLIVGAGIVGAACALECVASGLTVTVVEPAVVGGGATAAGMGHIVVMDDSEAQFQLTNYSEGLWHELAPQLPSDCEYLPCGTMWVAADEDEFAEVLRKHQFYSLRNVVSHVLDGSEIAEAEPKLRAGLAGGLLVPGDCVVYSPCVARYLLEEAEKGGARLHHWPASAGDCRRASYLVGWIVVERGFGSKRLWNSRPRPRSRARHPAAQGALAHY